MTFETDRVKDKVGSPKQGRTIFRMASFVSILTVLAFVAFLAINVDSSEASTLNYGQNALSYAQDYFSSAPSPPDESVRPALTDGWRGSAAL